LRIASIEMDEEEEMKEMNNQQQQNHGILVTEEGAVISPYRMNPEYRRQVKSILKNAV
jgi:hypothetical protein